MHIRESKKDVWRFVCDSSPDTQCSRNFRQNVQEISVELAGVFLVRRTVLYFFSYKMDFFFPSKNNPKNLDPSYQEISVELAVFSR